jgi:hypothetical protein
MHMEHKTITKLLQETGSEKTDLNTKLMLKTFFIVCHYKINIFIVCILLLTTNFLIRCEIFTSYPFEIQFQAKSKWTFFSWILFSLQITFKSLITALKQGWFFFTYWHLITTDKAMNEHKRHILKEAIEYLI